MRKVLALWLAAVFGACLLLQPAVAAGGTPRHLVDAEWLEKNLGRDDVLVLDASPPPMYAAWHIAGAVPVDLFSFGGRDVPVPDMERLFQSWGVSPDRQVIIYDQGGSYMATRVFFDLYYHGFPAERLAILDGGLAKWLADGRPVTKDRTAARPGNFRITQQRSEARVHLAEFVTATGDPARHAVVEALEPAYHFGETRFFDRAGHVPNAIMMPSGDFYNADKTFKSPQEIARMAAHLGIRPEQQVHTHCGGGVAASVPFFALKFMLGYPRVSLYRESQLEWLQDERGLPFWTYDAPFLKRDAGWLQSWSNRMLRTYGVTKLSVVDIRPAGKFAQGHVPYALNVPAEVFRRHLDQPEQLAALLGPAGVDPAHEAVIVSDGGLNGDSALAFLALERLGQQRVSILMESVDEWGFRGLPLTKEPTAVGPKKSPMDLSIPPTAYRASLRPGVTVREGAAAGGAYPKVFVASGKAAPARLPQGKLVHLPAGDLLNADGTPKAAKDLWALLAKAGVPRYAEIVCIADDPADAAVAYFVLRLMGFPDVKVQLG